VLLALCLLHAAACCLLLLLQLVGLYKLHIENTEVPPNFAVLLQLRQMLGLDADTAEQIEADVLRQSQAFSI
jgi:hypothetical protein